MIGFRFQHYQAPQKGKPFDKLFNVFRELLVYTSGDVPEALNWLTELDKEYQLTSNNYGMGNFIEDLRREGLIRENEDGTIEITSKTEQSIRRQSLEQVFGKLKKIPFGKP